MRRRVGSANAFRNWRRSSGTISPGTSDSPVAAVELEVDGETLKATAEGDGPVDAAFKAISLLG